MNNSPTIKKTKDGSTTLYSNQFEQHYHNPNGAVSESRHVFFETPAVPAALSKKKELNVFEVGFGTGLNLILLLDYLEKTKSHTKITFHSVEAFPVDIETAGRFDFGENLQALQPFKILSEIFGNLQPGMNQLTITDQVQLKLFVGFFDAHPVTSTQAEDTSPFDFIFHDAFSPEVNADLWTPEVFRHLAKVSRPDAVLSTYCAATSARAAMAVAGWKVARAQGALGKREMTVASLDPENLNDFKRVNEKRLVERFEKGDFG
ncbi:MAG: tRNA (5-methylaminomethyl-2-thiouridine)(34)-methyltransferase MnmD [Balneolaceae bacterium]